MDWPLVGFTAAATWFVTLVVDDASALFAPRARSGLAHTLAFVASLAACLVLGVMLVQGHRSPCPPRLR